MDKNQTPSVTRTWRPTSWIRFACILSVVMCFTLAPTLVSIGVGQVGTRQTSSSASELKQIQQTSTTRANRNVEKKSQVEVCQCRPRQHVYYLKTHKTGSTTMYSILAEYCRSHQLQPLLPSAIHINLSPPLLKSQLLLDRDVHTYDMVFNHHIFTPEILEYLHNDTFVFTILREPFEHTVSSFQYFREMEGMVYLTDIKAKDPIREYFSNRLKYEPEGYTSFTNNRQSMDLGYDIGHSFSDTKYINEFIALTDSRFDLVLIFDYFHESLIILKRSLRWETEDILHYRKNARIKSKRYELQNVSMEIPRKQHAQYSQADISLYAFFLKSFKSRMAREKDLQGEVAEFESVLAKVHAFCDNTGSSSRLKRLDIPAGRWTDPVSIFRDKCTWLKMAEVRYTQYLKTRQRSIFKL